MNMLQDDGFDGQQCMWLCGPLHATMDMEQCVDAGTQYASAYRLGYAWYVS